MKVAVILGNRLNDDGSITAIMEKRLQLALKIANVLAPDKIIVSGGVANPAAGQSEAAVMKQWLVNHGVSCEKVVVEEKSMTTAENALFSVPIAADLGATELILCTSREHMKRIWLNPKRLFKKQLKKYSQIALFTCCTEQEIEMLAKTC